MKNPPNLQNYDNYESWEKAIDFWLIVTDIPAKIQGPSLVLSLTGRARDIALELPKDEIHCDAGVKNILKQLAKVYKKDSVDSAYQAFEKFIHFSREPDMSIPNYVNEFEQRYSKAKAHGCELSTSIQAFFLLEQAKLSEDHKKLIRATLTKLDFEEMVSKLKKVFSADSSDTRIDDLNIKVEDINISEDVLYGNNTSFNRGGYWNRSNDKGRFPVRPNRGYYNSYPRSSSRFSGASGRYRYPAAPRFYASNDDKNRKLKCSYCESIFHKVSECPEKIYYGDEFEQDESHDIVLFQSSLIIPNSYNVFVAESTSAAILDSGASAIMLGKRKTFFFL